MLISTLPAPISHLFFWGITRKRSSGFRLFSVSNRFQFLVKSSPLIYFVMLSLSIGHFCFVFCESDGKESEGIHLVLICYCVENASVGCLWEIS